MRIIKFYLNAALIGAISLTISLATENDPMDIDQSVACSMEEQQPTQQGMKHPREESDIEEPEQKKQKTNGTPETLIQLPKNRGTLEILPDELLVNELPKHLGSVAYTALSLTSKDFYALLNDKWKPINFDNNPISGPTGIELKAIIETRLKSNNFTFELKLDGARFTDEILIELMPTLYNMPWLDRLYLTFNKIFDLTSHVYPALWNLKSLTELDLGKNQLKALPESLVDLKNLKKLDLCCNQLDSIPDKIGKFTNLKALDLGNNQLKIFPASLVELKNLKKLDLYGNQLDSIPDKIGKLTNLTELDLERNQLKALPFTIGFLIHLKSLNLSNNQLKDLPWTIGNLLNLIKLKINENELIGLPTEIGNLRNLEYLSLRKNPITFLVSEIWNLEKLKKLSMWDTKITSLSPHIGKLSNLEKLDVSCNESLKSLPLQIKNLTNLKHLLLDDQFSDTELIESIKKALPQTRIGFCSNS